MIKVVLVALLVFPNGSVRMHAFTDEPFYNVESCHKVGKALQITRKDVVSYTCVESTDV